MPSVFKQSGQQLSTGQASSGGLRSSLLSGRAVGRLRAPQVNPNAANVRWSNQAVPTVKDNALLRDTLALGNTLVAETERFNERRDRVLANEALLEYKDNARKTLYGEVGEDGKIYGGYLNL
jgi:hypothetical protein